MPLARFRSIIEYDGTDFAGWQIQPDQRTIQGEIVKGISQITGETVKLTGSGRTDAGVHAFGQVADFAIEKEIDPFKFLVSLNAVTPEDIAVKTIQEVDESFDSRRDADSRVYTYRIHIGPTALQRRFVWQINYELDVEKMNEAAREILGDHDFKAFCIAKSQKEMNNCRVIEASWKRLGYEALFTIEANRFLHGMVRMLVGDMVRISKDQLTIEQFKRKIISGEKSKEPLSVPPQGLTLVMVKY
ncbi:MAG: tRNA pseudouridine(38-40) synthase TruA [candidate division Zixibacteria bacterium]|nr:tRNA pseudouridine(38-40) synthase TruA [candidate division Zixibacteria bacterium]